MSMETSEIEDARLVDKFMAEMKKIPASPLRLDYAKAIKPPPGEQRDAETKRVLQKHGYEKLSPAKLSELLHERPHDVSHIKPPVLSDKTDETKPKFDWDLYTGAYLITSLLPENSRIKEITRIGIQANGDISWDEGEKRKQFPTTTKIAKQVAPDGKETWDYWAVWGDKESEWFSAQFFGVSENKKKPSFVGYRYIKGVEKPLAFNGTKTEKCNQDDAEFWINVTLGGAIGLILAGAVGYIIYKYRRYRAQQIHDIIRQEENRQMEEKMGEVFLEGQESHENNLLEKEVEEMLRDSDAKHERDLADRMTEKIKALDFGEIGPDGKLTEAQRAKVDAFMKTEMNKLVNEQYGPKSIDIQTKLAKPESFAERIIESARARYEKAGSWNPQLGKFEGSLGNMVEHNLLVRHVEDITLREKKILDRLKEVPTEGRQVNSKAYDVLQYLRGQVDMAIEPKERADTLAAYDKAVAKLKTDGEAHVEKVHELLVERSGKRTEAVQLRKDLKEGKEKADRAKLEARRAIEAVKPRRRIPVV
ncbi:hypothetical protein V8C37DRAFT_388462 [Trichoderma ceciliae]